MMQRFNLNSSQPVRRGSPSRTALRKW